MQWPPVCDNCKCVLDEPGALIIAPPNSENVCKKFHICIDVILRICFYFLLKNGMKKLVF